MLLLWLFLVLLLVWMHCQPKVPCSGPTPTPAPLDLQPTQEPVPSYVQKEEQNGGTILMKVGDIQFVSLFGNATTGYAWRIVKKEGDSVIPDTKWRYQLEQPFLMGSGGYFQMKFTAIQPGMTDVYFINDPVSDPQMGYDYYLQFDVRS